jgi:dihydrofolate reductase
MAQKVLTHMTMSLDGYIATPSDGIDHIFDWYGAGDVSLPTANKDITLRIDQASAEMMRELVGTAGALISGRRLFDITNGWNDSHPIGTPVVVVTHRPPPPDAAKKWPRTSFVNGVEAAVKKAREIAGDKNVVISSANILQQAIALGLVDEICISLTPVLLGGGISYFSKLPKAQLLEDPVVIQGHRALHLRYPVRH